MIEWLTPSIFVAATMWAMIYNDGYTLRGMDAPQWTTFIVCSLIWPLGILFIAALLFERLFDGSD